jgi:hypothetical protein
MRHSSGHEERPICRCCRAGKLRVHNHVGRRNPLRIGAGARRYPSSSSCRFIGIEIIIFGLHDWHAAALLPRAMSKTLTCLLPEVDARVLAPSRGTRSRRGGRISRPTCGGAPAQRHTPPIACRRRRGSAPRTKRAPPMSPFGTAWDTCRWTTWSASIGSVRSIGCSPVI